MSQRGRDVVRYIKAVERGPEYEIWRRPGSYYEWLGSPQNDDWYRAWWKDLTDPVTNAVAAARYIRAKWEAQYGPPRW